jgi:peptidylprolyl isomerase
MVGTDKRRLRRTRWPVTAAARAATAAVAVALAATAACADEADPEVAEDAAPGPGIGDHWHAAYGVFVCDAFLPPEPEGEDTIGLHTHGDGVVHIHPFVEQASGPDATFGVFLRSTEIEVGDGELTAGGETWADGDDCGGEPGTVQVATWDDATAGGEPDDVRAGTDGLRFREDGEAYTIAFVPEGAEIPVPPTAGQLAELGASDGGGTTGTSAGGGTGGAGGTTGPPGGGSGPDAFTDPALAAEVLGRTPPDVAPPPADTPPDTVEVATMIEGRGEPAAPGDTLTVHYVGVLDDGSVFDASWARGDPFPVTLGQGMVIPGWEEGLVGARPGERRRLVLGSATAYGEAGTPDGSIPPGAPLAFVVDVVDIAR